VLPLPVVLLPSTGLALEFADLGCKSARSKNPVRFSLNALIG
jgi:hypothetical protein